MISKLLTIKLFYNLANQLHYIQLGGTIYSVPATWAIEIKKREGLDIRSARDVHDMQEIRNNDKV